MLNAADVEQFRRDGFLLLRDVFGADEVQRFIAAGAEGSRTADLLALPDLEGFWSDSRLVEIAKLLLGGTITFFGEASYLKEVFKPGEAVHGRHLHHDAKGTLSHLFNRQHEPTDAPYPIIRFAVYLQDHANFSGGLKLVPGSHQFNSANFNEDELTYYDVPAMPGDLVVFCNKILHSPYALRRKASPHIGLPPRRENVMSAADPEAFLPAPVDRNVIFVDFAGSNALADIYIKGRAIIPTNTRSGLVQAFQHGPLVKDAERVGANLRLDAGIVEALTKVAASVKNGAIGEAGLPYLAALPRLCRFSRSWSPHFDFVPEPSADDTLQAGLDLYSKMVPRIAELLALIKTMRRDEDMAAYHGPKASVS
jgi:hypothetical protein